MRRCVEIAWVFGCLSLAACAVKVPSYKINNVSVVERHAKLENGLNVVVETEPALSKVILLVRYEVGGANDPPGKAGLAHLVEHLAFRVGETLVERSESGDGAVAGAGTGAVAKRREVNYLSDSNASTSIDATTYYHVVAPAHVARALRELAKQMGDFSGELSESVLETERAVVQSERKERYDAGPYRRASLDVHEHFYPKGHPYHGLGTIGSLETIAAINLDDVSAFLQKHYHPANATLVLVGPLDPEKTLSLVERIFGEKSSKPKVKLEVPEWKPTQKRVTIQIPEAKSELLRVVWPLDGEFSDEALAARFICDRASFGYDLSFERDFAHWASCWVEEDDLESRFVVSAMLKSGVSADRVASKIIDTVIALPVGDKTSYLQARRRRVYRELLGLDSPMNRAEQMAEYQSRFGAPTAWNDVFARLESLDVSRLKETAKSFLTRENAFVMLHTPDDPQSAAPMEVPTEDDVRVDARVGHEKRDLPEKTYDFAWPFGDFQRWAERGAQSWKRALEGQLPNGIRYRIVHQAGFPIMVVEAAFGGGEIAQPPELGGVADVTMRSLGVSGRAARTRWSRMGVRQSFYTRPEYVNYTARFLSHYQDLALSLIAKKLTDPELSAQWIRAVRDVDVWEADEAEGSLNNIAYRALWKSRGLERLARTPTASTLSDIGYLDVRRYYNDVFYPENMMLAIASDRPPRMVERAIRDAFGGWAPAGKPPVSLDTSAPSTADVPNLVMVEHDASQTKLIMAFRVDGWEDWKTALLVDAVAEVLDDEAAVLREAMGVTYGTHIYPIRWRDHGVLLLSTNVDAPETREALKAVKDILSGLSKTTIDAGKLEAVKRRLIDGLVDREGTGMSRAWGHLRMMLEGRPPSYREEAIQWIGTFTAEGVGATIAEILGAEPTLVVVGPDPEVATPKEPTGDGTPRRAVRYRVEDLF